MSTAWETGATDTTHDNAATNTTIADDDVTSEEVTTPAAAPPTLTKEEYVEKARAAGWNEATAVDYAKYQLADDNDEWRGKAQVYEWTDEFGEVGPQVPALEAMLFGGEFQMRKGMRMDPLMLEVTMEGPEQIAPIRDFDSAGLHPVMRSGKTAAYLIPVLSRLMGKAKKLCGAKAVVGDPTSRVVAQPLVVIVAPTRELAMQIFDEARRLCYRSMLRPCVAYGGLPMKICIEELQKGCDILIASPGRLCDLMDKPHILTMSRVKYTIIDEADEMLDADWEEELGKIMAGGDTNADADHFFFMFSATFPARARRLANDYMDRESSFRMRIGRAGQTHRNIKQVIINVDQNMKRDAIFDLLYAMVPGRTLIFCNSRITVDLLDDFLFNRGLPTTSIHGERPQREREDAIRSFRTGKSPILIATGVSARGLDIAGIVHVINYDLPSTLYGGIQEYIHRIGRTARIGHEGLATSFYNDKNEDLAQDLVNVLVECQQEVPDFLSHLAPEDGVVVFDDGSDDEAEDEDETGRDDQAPAAENAGFVAEGAGWGAAPTTAGGAFEADGGQVATAAGW
ncbi:hypothetical protein LTR62_004629 [Meristemomyces frigidus]|uniref:RNA helicase n=1 Tax=Meristemomyces frigidus TaxID=1508187 RepID=A0AAN7TEC2_9PEZI|nr:hypothetical protein LTR62_004629 [Meristemomyces frigidus]